MEFQLLLRANWDYEIMHKLCSKCKVYKINYTQQEFQERLVKHKEWDECEINHTESSGEMEAAAALLIFSPSEQKSKLRFQYSSEILNHLLLLFDLIDFFPRWRVVVCHLIF